MAASARLVQIWPIHRPTAVCTRKDKAVETESHRYWAGWVKKRNKVSIRKNKQLTKLGTNAPILKLIDSENGETILNPKIKIDEVIKYYSPIFYDKHG